LWVPREVPEQVLGGAEDGCVSLAHDGARLDAPQAGVVGFGAAALSEVGFEEQAEAVAGAAGRGADCFGCRRGSELS
jgi:hypothetical protein